VHSVSYPTPLLPRLQGEPAPSAGWYTVCTDRIGIRASTVHLRPWCSWTNVLFRHPPHVPLTGQAAPGAMRDGLGERRSPRAARFPFLSPTRRGRGPGGRGEPPGVLRSTDTGHVGHPFRHCELPACITCQRSMWTSACAS